MQYQQRHTPGVCFLVPKHALISICSCSVTSKISETVVLIAARVPLKGKGVISRACGPSSPSFPQACPGAPRRTASLGRVHLHVEGQVVQWINFRFIILRASDVMALCRVGRFDNAADGFVPTTRPASCTCSGRVRGACRRALTAAVDVVMGAVGAGCAWTDVWYMLCRSLSTDGLVEHSRGRDRHGTGDDSTADRVLDSSPSQAVREAAATDRTFGAAIAGANLRWVQCRPRLCSDL